MPADMPDALTPDALDELRRLHDAATPGPWESDTVENADAVYGFGDDEGIGFDARAIYSPDGKVLFDSLNSDAGEVLEEWGDDETHGSAWDEVAKQNAALIAATRNALPALIAAAEREQPASSALAIAREALERIKREGAQVIDRIGENNVTRDSPMAAIAREALAKMEEASR